MDTAMPKA